MLAITPKRTISLLLVLAMLTSILTIPALAAPTDSSIFLNTSSITMSPVSTGSTSATISIQGYDNLIGGILYILIGNSSDIYGDPKIVASTAFNGPQDYTLPFNGKYELHEDDTLLPYIYYYDGDTDAVICESGELITVTAVAPVVNDSITMTAVNTSSNGTTVTVTGHDSMKGGTLYVLIGDTGDMYGDGKIVASTSFKGEGQYELTFNEKYTLKEGDTLLPYLYKYDGDTDSLVYKPGELVTVTAATSTPEIIPGKTPFEILANCKVQLMKDGAVRTEPFQEHEGTVDVKVQLDPGVPSCTLNIYAFASTTSFDPESTHNISLWGGTVTNGTEQTCTFNVEKLSQLEVGYSIAASLYVCVDPETDYYLSSHSQVLEIVDENGQGFQPYAYPNASIAETELKAGDQILHLNLTGDDRIFQAAKEEKTSINLAICQYPADDAFDFESEHQISLYSRQSITAPITNEEIRLSEPLKPGYRVRAVVYWSQNVDLHLVKGNDYESVFNCPDDSVRISGEPEIPDAPVVVIETKLTPSTKNLLVTTTGSIPTGTRLLVKSYGSEEEIVLSKGKLVAAEDAAVSVVLSPDKGSLISGDRVTAFLVNAGTILAQSSITVVEEDAPPAPIGTIALTSMVTSDSKDATVVVSGYEEMIGGQLFLILGHDMYDNSKIIGSAHFIGPGEFHLTLNKNVSLKTGDEIMPYLYFYNAEADRTEYTPGTISHVVEQATEPEVTPGTTPEEILANCSVVLLQDGQPRTAAFRENEVSTQVKVKLDPGVESCYLTIFAYSSNTSFDPDASHNIRLWSEYVTDGQTLTCNFNQAFLPLKPGYSIIACLNVPVAEDWYRPVNSDPFLILDENGQGFEDYDPYPDASIVETSLTPGATSLHINLVADPRIFEAAKAGKTSINIAVAQYPADDSFDFESNDQISIYSAQQLTAPITNKEIQFSEPLKPGYRVRAVVYWEQNSDLHLVKGNDYEDSFHRPDDSVLISETVPQQTSVAISSPVTSTSDSVNVTITGTIPPDALLLVKAFDSGEVISFDRGTPVTTPVPAAPSVTLIPKAGTLKDGKQLVAFLLHDGSPLAQSQPVSITAGGEVDPSALSVRLTDRIVTKGDTVINASADWDQSLGSQAHYTLYQFTGDTLNRETAQILSEGTVYRSFPKMMMNVGTRLVTSSHLQVVLSIGSKEALSNMLTVEPSPDWGTPTVTLDVASVSADANSIPVFVQYSEEYLTMGDEFYCDVTLYQIPGNITDEEFADNEWWENSNYSTRIGQINSRLGDETMGHVEISVLNTVTLEPGSRIIAKLRLPHTEWEGEEVDYLSLSVPVVNAGAKPLTERVILLNLGSDTDRGHQVRSILNDLGMEVITVTNKDLDELAGYLAGLPGYEETPGEYSGHLYTTEFMLMCNLSETRLDQFLAAMQKADLFIGHKAIMTETTKDLALYEIIDLIIDEHLEVTKDTLAKLVIKAEALEESEYGDRADWDALQLSIAKAKDLLNDEQSEISDLEAAKEELNSLYVSVLNGKAEITYTKVEEVPATRTSSGMKEHYIGSDGKIYVLEDGVMVETAADDLVIPRLPSPPITPAEPVKPVETVGAFKDVNSQDWFYEDVQYVYENGLMNGTSTFAFSPSTTANRAMLVTILYRMAGSPAISTDVSFKDVSSNSYYYPALCWAFNAGVITGYDAETFGTDDAVTREDTITILFRFMKYQNLRTVSGSLTGYIDASCISDYALEAMSWAVGSELLQGRDSNLLVPTATATRAELAAFIHRFCVQ